MCAHISLISHMQMHAGVCVCASVAHLLTQAARHTYRSRPGGVHASESTQALVCEAVGRARSVSARQAARNQPRPAGTTPRHLGIASGREDEPHHQPLPPRPPSHRRHCGLLDGGPARLLGRHGLRWAGCAKRDERRGEGEQAEQGREGKGHPRRAGACARATTTRPRATELAGCDR